MSLTLYRKYRPQTFKEVIGQNHIKITLQNELETGRLTHAYLFSGPRGLGKTTVARLLAKAANCLQRKEGQSEPCNSCDACQEIINNRSLDVIEIDAASHTGVENVRENIINTSRFTPTSRKFKVFIIDEIHMLSISAFNALLKTLEEPPAHVIFILATTEIHKVPQTIISRCQRFDFRKVPLKDLIARLSYIVNQEKKKIDQAILENIAYHAEGCVRDAETFLGQVLSLDEKEITLEQAELVIPVSHFNLVLELIAYLIKKDATPAINLVNRLIQEGVDLQRFTSDLIETLRKILLIKISSQLEEFTFSLDQKLEQQIAVFSKKIDLPALIFIIDTFIDTKKELKSAEINQLPLEMAIVEICSSPDEIDNDIDADGTNNPSESKINQSVNKPIEKKTIQTKKQLGKIKLTLEQIKDKWEEILVWVKKYNQSLASTLKQHQPTAIKDDGTLEICFKYKFHQQRVNEVKNKQALEQVLERIFNVPLKVEAVIVKELPEDRTETQTLTEKSSDSRAVDDILKTFGGQVVE